MEESGVWDGLYEVSTWIIPVFAGIILHEIAHGYAALYFGDRTAYRAGRLSLNPLRHVDPFGTVIFPLLLVLSRSPFLFGWARPVPVHFGALNNPKRDMVWVALAGPAVNFVLALSALGILALCKAFGYIPSFWMQMTLVNTVLFNFSIMVFNLIPVLPMDGGRILTGLLPVKWAAAFSKTEKYGFMVLVSVLILLPLLGDYFGRNWNFVVHFLGLAVQGLVHFFARAAGIIG